MSEPVAGEHFRVVTDSGVPINATKYSNLEASLQDALRYVGDYDDLYVVRVTEKPVKRVRAQRSVTSQDIP